VSFVPGRPFPVERGADLSGVRAVVMGLGRFSGGVETVRWLVGKGARVTVTDLAPEEKLAESVAAVRDLGVRLVLGGHDPDDFTAADLVVASPAVPPESALLAAAAAAGVPLMTELSITMRLLPCPVVFVTGTCGKSTTTALLGEMLGRSSRHVLTGGNIGKALICEAETAGPADLAVIEVSSFQLEWLDRDGIFPSLAVVTNVTPNHLDRHGTFERYLAAKAAALPPPGPVILNRDDPACRDRLSTNPMQMRFWTSLEGPAETSSEAPVEVCAWLDGDVARLGGVELFRLSDLRLLGEFNRMNALQAAVAARILEAEPAHIVAGLRAFGGLPHRLQDLGVRDGVRGVDDSKATTPEAAGRGIEAISGGIVLVAGGFERGAELTGFAETIRGRVRLLVLLGESASRLADAVGEGGPETVIVGSIEEAVDAGLARAAPGETLLLSPGHASWDMYASYEERGDRFRERFIPAGL